MIFAKIEMMEHLPPCCDACDLQVEDGGWCAVLPEEKQRPMVADMDGLSKRKACPLCESFRELYSGKIDLVPTKTTNLEIESRC